MVNGRIHRDRCRRAELAADRELQQRLSGVGRHDEAARRAPAEAARRAEQLAEVYRVVRVGDGGPAPTPADVQIYRAGHRTAEPLESCRSPQHAPDCRRARAPTAMTRRRKLFAMPFAERIGRTVLVAGTFDTKGKELRFIADRLKALGIPVGPSICRPRASRRAPTCRPCRWPACTPAARPRVMSGDRGAVGRGHGGGLRALDRAGAAHRRRHLGRRLRRHHAGHGRHAARCRSAFPS